MATASSAVSPVPVSAAAPDVPTIEATGGAGSDLAHAAPPASVDAKFVEATR